MEQVNSSQPENQMLALLKRMGKLPMMKPPSESPLSMPQVAMLNWVARHPGCGVREIAAGLHVTPPTVSVGVRRLVADGWLEQRNDPDDRRARPIFLTEKGSNLVNVIRDHRTLMLSQFLSGLTDDEQGQLIYLLDRAISALENAAQAQEG
jgi:DNA-binding MarR family transcriptional regulator